MAFWLVGLPLGAQLACRDVQVHSDLQLCWLIPLHGLPPLQEPTSHLGTQAGVGEWKAFLVA